MRGTENNKFLASLSNSVAEKMRIFGYWMTQTEQSEAKFLRTNLLPFLDILE